MIVVVAAVLSMFGVISAATFALLLPSIYLLDTGLLWVAFLGIMKLKDVRDAGRLPPDVERIAEVALVCGLGIDLLYNWSWAIVVYLDFPRECLVTQRLKRYKYGDNGLPTVTGWRLRRTLWYCDNMLDPFDSDPRGHVHP